MNDFSTLSLTKIPTVISFTGAMGVGKTTVLEMLKTNLMEHHVSFKYVKFAEALYNMQKAIYNLARLPQPKEKDRKLLQWLGTEWGRSIDPNLWVNIFKGNCEDALHDKNLPIDVIINDDCRFDNEGQTVKDMGGIVIKIVGHTHDGETMVNKGHASENGLSVDFIDFVLDNSGSLDDLKKNIEILTDKLVLEPVLRNHK